MEKVIAIGALGGSGTRAVAKILMECGVHIGDRLNGPLDNIVFAGLFRRPDWFDIEDEHEIHRRLELFQEYMKHDRLSTGSVMALRKRKKLEKNFPWRFYLERAFKKKQDRELWGWKEPNTHFYLEAVDRFFEHFKYIHVIRHGLDMAFSGNMAQLKNWGSYYGIPFSGKESPPELAVKQLDFWIKANREVIRKSERNGIDMHLLHHHHLCEEPDKAVKSLLDALELKVDRRTFQNCTVIPKLPSSSGRYREKDLSIFREDQLKEVESFGFPIEEPH